MYVQGRLHSILLSRVCVYLADNSMRMANMNVRLQVWPFSTAARDSCCMYASLYMVHIVPLDYWC